MKSSKDQLINRGWVGEDYITDSDKTVQELIALLKSKQATERTISARILAEKGDIRCIEELCHALEREKTLYTKLEICNALVSFGENAVQSLVDRLGSIGSNQYIRVETAAFKKNSYPLPRDICARTLIRIGNKALPVLKEVLVSNDIKKISEVVNAIGFICFYNGKQSLFDDLKKCYEQYYDNELIQWKIIRAMSAFVSGYHFLIEQIKVIGNEVLKREALRSIKLIEKKSNMEVNDLPEI
jgi:hypothetical protein